MKLITCFLIVLHFFFHKFSYTQPNNNLLQDVVLPAPNAAALGKYTDIPVSHFTGVPGISIPIYTVLEGSLILPISLNYHASGVKVGETASWVGMGWSLDAGGMISRTVLGIPDERSFGYANYGNTLTADFNDGGISQTISDDIISGAKDSEPDIFMFNFAGQSGKFVIDGDKICHLIPQQNLRVEIEWGVNVIKGFTIVDPGGIKYIFGNIPDTLDDRGVESSVLFGINPDNPDAEITNTWYLIRVESPDKIYRIDLSYADEYYSYNYLASCNYSRLICNVNDTQGIGGGSGGGETTIDCGGIGDAATGKNLIRNSVNGKRLTKITTISGNVEVNFVANTIREDLDNSTVFVSEQAHLLDQIKVEHNSSCSVWDFSYSYFKDPLLSTRSEYKRLKLKQVKQSDCTYSEQIPPYKFYYNGSQNAGDTTQFLPNRLSKAIDHWGFYNGATDNEYSENINIPLTTLDLFVGGSISYGDNNRDTDPTWVKTGVLNKLVYPTGGVHEFEYEANSYVQIGTEVIENDITTLISCGEAGSECYAPYARCYNSKLSHVVTFDSLAQIDSSRLLIDLRVPPHLVEGFTGTIQWNSCYASYNYNPTADIPNDCYAYGFHSIKLKVIKVADSSEVGEISSEINLIETNELCISLNPLLTDLAINQNFEVGVAYKFILEVSNGLGEAKLFTRYSNQNVPLEKYAGGLRVKEIRSKISESESGYARVKKYSYTDSSNTQSSGKLFFTPDYGYRLEVYGGGVTVVNAYFQEQSIVPLGTFDGRHIGYSRVIESETGNGQIEYLFNIEDPVTVGVFFPNPPQLATIKNGSLYRQNTYTENSNTYIQSSRKDFDITYKSIPGAIFKMKLFPNTCSNPMLPPNFYQIQTYTPRTSALYLQADTVLLDQVVTSQLYSYSPDTTHFFPVRITTTNSDNRIQEQRFKYPLDYNPILPIDPNSTTTVQSLINKYMIGTPIETQTWEGTLQSMKLIHGQITLYKNFGSGNDTVLKPFEIHLLSTDSPLGSDAIDNDLVNGKYKYVLPGDISERYKDRAHFEYESTYGNLIEQSLTDGTPVTYLWGYQGNRPIAQFVGATKALVDEALTASNISRDELNTFTNSAIMDIELQEIRAYLSDMSKTNGMRVLITTYLYNDRLQVVSVKGPDGVQTSYDYDELGRLIETRDNEHQLLQRIEYNYQK